MARESHDVAVALPEDGTPTLAITLDQGPVDLTERLSGADDGQLPARDIDVTYRETQSDRSGVLALANRLTGEFILEAPIERERVRALVDAVRYGPDDQYRLELRGGRRRVTLSMDALLVYDVSGSLLAGQSLVPGGVEL